MTLSLRRWPERSQGEQGAMRRFGTRMFLSMALTLVAMGIVGDLVISHQLGERQIASYASTQRADVESFNAIGKREPDPVAVLREVGEVIDAIGRRPGTIDTLLVDRQASSASPTTSR